MPTVFRWNIARREQLGRLVDGEPAESYPEFIDDLRGCCARVIAMAGDSWLVFVGRSPESLFDYLTGALARTSWSNRLAMLNISLWRYGRDDDGTPNAPGVAALRGHLGALGLDPENIAGSARPIALIDIVSSGDTLGALVAILLGWATEAGADVRAVRRRLRIVGITERQPPSPTTWRWRTDTSWAPDFRPSALRGVSVPGRLWDYLGNSQPKVARTNPPPRWGDPEMERPPREGVHAMALRLAVAVHDAGSSRIERHALAAAIASQPAMRYRWCRTLVAELRLAGRPKGIEHAFLSKPRVRSRRRERTRGFAQPIRSSRAP